MTESSLQSSFDAVLERAEAEGEDWLFSYTIKIKEINPDSFFASGRGLFKGERFFWKSRDGKTVLVGLGVAYTISNHNPDNRFEEVKSEWAVLLKHSMIHNPFDTPATGPLLFGGFSFDPYSLKEKEWGPFSDSLFYLPRYMLTNEDGEYFLTVNSMCPSAVPGVLEDNDLALLLDKAVAPHQKESNIISQEAVRPEEWKKAVADTVEVLKREELNKVVLARKTKLEFDRPVNPDTVLFNLATQQSNSYLFAFETNESCFVGASPERLAKKMGQNVLSASLAGSIRRGTSQEEDRQLGEELLGDPKNRYEHQLVVSMIKDALKPHCDQLDMPQNPELLKMPDIQHLFTPVRGKAKQETSLFDIVGDLHPTPAMGGVPTKAAMKVIRDKEGMDRGFYAAPLGWTDYRGNGEFMVAIRSGLLTGQEAYLYAGCGVVADSDPESEFAETGIKFRPMLRATGGNHA
ncbi:MAG TPA: isochorismate synthase [Bacillaceae bacterium]